MNRKSVPFSLLIFRFPWTEPDGMALGWRRLHKLTDSIENYFELGIILLLQGIKFASQISMRCKYPSETNKCPHDFDINLNGTFAPEYAR
jgi:hypothetical protein